MGRHQPVPPEPDRDVALPGSGGEHALQRHAGSQDRAHRFYRQQVLAAGQGGRPGAALGQHDPRAKGGDHFGAGCEPRPWVAD
jgi:hypothetical protein